MRIIACLFLAAQIAAEDAVNLLQIGSIKSFEPLDLHSGRKTRRHKGQQCPPKPAAKDFGCNGQTQFHLDKGTRQCSFWGEPHISSTFGTAEGGQAAGGFVNENYDKMKEVSYATGLFRMARAVDESWEVQVFSCGLIAGAAVLRFGNTTIEVAMPGNENGKWGGKPVFLINGVGVPHGNLPGELPDGSFLGPHHKVTFGMGYQNPKNADGSFAKEEDMGAASSWKSHWFTWGSCADDPKGQIRVEITSSYQEAMGNLMNVLLEAAEGSYVDGPDEERVSTCPGDKWIDAKPLDASESLFTNPTDICAACKDVWTSFGDWRGGNSHPQDVGLGKAQCKAIVMDKAPRADEMCAARSISMDHARQACSHLDKKPVFFEDCVYDVCSTGSDAAANNAEAEEEEENPEPRCIKESANCVPQSICCDDDASRGLNLNNVVQNNLDGSGAGPSELRFGQVIDGIDLLITCPDYTCTRGNEANGVHGVLGSLAVDSSTTHTFSFTFVASGTNNPTSPGNAVMSFLDLDQGKKSKQRESVKICGLASPIITSNSELETTFSNSCSSATSTGRGTGKDNPEDPATMDDVQRARTIAFPLQGKSSFSVELGVSTSGKRKSPRRFLFTGHPTVACL